VNTPRTVPIDDLLAHRRLVSALARRFVDDADLADDVAQDAWVSVLRSPPSHRRGLVSWLAHVVRSRAGDAWRTEKRRVRLEQSAPIPRTTTAPDETAEKVDVVRRVVEAVAALPEPYRTTVVLRFYDDLAVAEIAARMTVPEATVRTRLSRAFARLRAHLGEDEDDRSTWFALFVPLRRARRISETTFTGALAMSLKLWVGAGAVAALLAAALIYSPSADEPRRTVIAKPSKTVAAAASRPAPVSAPEARDPNPEPAIPSTAPTGALVVDLRTFHNAPVADADVELRLESREAPASDMRASSDETGVARFPRLPGGRWSLLARADGFADANGAVVVPPKSERRVSLFLDQSHEIRGVVRDARGAPVAGAIIDWVAPRPRPVVSDAAGDFVLSGVPSGEIQLRAGRSKDALSYAQLVRVPDISTIDVVLIDVPTVTVIGTVVDDASGAPIAGVEVGCAVLRPTPCLTDAEGRFRLAGVGRNFLELITLAKSGYRRFPAPRPATPIPDSAEVVDVGALRMQHGATIEGVVASPDDPIAGAVVTIVSPSRLTGSERREAKTDAAGRFAFESVEAGSTQIHVGAPGFISENKGAIHRALDIPESGTIRTDFAFTRGATVEGRVLDDDGRGVPGAYVVADVQVTTDADGAFRCEGVVPRTGAPVLVMADGYSRTDSTVDVRPGTTSNVVLRIRRSPVVRGRLVARDGRPIENARVQVVAGRTRGPARFSATDVPDGPFPVLADGSFEARVPSAATNAFSVVAWTTSHAPSASSPVAIVAGQREYVGVEVALDAGATIRGRVLVDGRGIAGAAIRLGFAGYGYSAPPIRTTTDAGGGFVVEHVATPTDGRLFVTASLAGYLDAVAKADTRDTAAVTLALGKPLDISGIVETPDHEPLTRLCVRADPVAPAEEGPVPPQHVAFTDADGRFRVRGLRTGQYRLTVVRQGTAPVTRDPVEAGTTDVALVVAR
jgi:RNA polymerase sigma-70 factor (ECF subfamily)